MPELKISLRLTKLKTQREKNGCYVTKGVILMFFSYLFIEVVNLSLWPFMIFDVQIWLFFNTSANDFLVFILSCLSLCEQLIVG